MIKCMEGVWLLLCLIPNSNGSCALTAFADTDVLCVLLCYQVATSNKLYMQCMHKWAGWIIKTQDDHFVFEVLVI